MPYTAPTWVNSSSPAINASNLNDLSRAAAAGYHFFNVKHPTYGAAGDGSTNDATAIQAAIDAASGAGGGSVFFPKGTFVTNSQLTVPSNVFLCGAGRGSSTIKIGANGINAVRLNSGADKCGLVDIAIDGNKGGITGTSHGVYILANSALVSNCRIASTRNNGIELEGGNDCRIANCDFASIDGSAARVVANADNTLIQGCSVSGCHNGVFVYDNGTGADCTRSRIIGNYIESCSGTNGALAQDGGIAINGGTFSLVEANVIRGNNGRGIHVFGNCPGSTIVGNEIYDCGVTNQVSGLDVGDVGDTNFVVTSNNVWRSGAAGIFVAGLKRSIVSNNMCVNNGQSSADAGNRNGITVNLTGAVQVTDCVFVGNHCYDSAGSPTQEYGIREWQGVASDYTNNVYANNNCRINKTGGISLLSTTAHVYGNISETTGLDIASAATITLGAHSNYFNITGTTTITSITAARQGRIVVLKFAAALTLTNGSNLKIGANFVTTADDVICLVCDGTNWYRVAVGAVN